MDSYIVNNIPSSNRKDFGYRSINTSASHNENQEEILNDILDLFNKTNSIEKVINEQMDYIKLENSMLESIYLAMFNKYKDMYQRYQSLLNISDEKKYISMPQDCTCYDEEFGAVIDPIATDITVRPSKKISKFVIFDSITNNVYIPDSLNVNIKSVNDKGIISATDNDIYAPFYNDNKLYWTRKVISDNTIESVETEYIIDLPEDIMTTPMMNEIYISPFLCMVKKVYGRYGDSNSWVEVPGQDSHDALIFQEGIIGHINNNRPFRLNFEETKINQLKIVVKASSYTENETNLRSFTFGIKQIGAYQNFYNDYEPNSFQFDVSLKENTGLMVTGVVPLFNNSGELGKYSKDFVSDIYYKDSKDYYHKIVDTFPFVPPTTDLRIKCKFGESYKESNIKRVELRYKSNFKLPPDIDISDIKQIDSKGSSVVALKTDGTIWTWGNNVSGQLTTLRNVGAWDNSNTVPVKVKITNVKDISVGLDYTLALKNDGTVWSFGDNFYGQLGKSENIKTHEANIVPTKINNLTDVVQISAGSWHATALKTDGTVWSWGYNYYGQLGNSNNVKTHEPNFTPTKVEGLSSIKKIEAGFWHSTAVDTNNTMYSWGYNQSGQLGYETESEVNYTPKAMNIF